MSSPEAAGAVTDPAPVPREKHAAKLYDFKRPDKFTKDQIVTVAIMHETLARQASSVLSSMLRTTAHLHVASVDQLTYEEFIRSLPNPTTMATVLMEPLKGAAVLQLDPGITSAMVDRLFGGAGRASAENRELTDIECGILEGALTRLLGPFRAAWTTIIDLQPRLLAIETNPQLAQVVSPREMIVLASLEGQIGEGHGFINIALPFSPSSQSSRSCPRRPSTLRIGLPPQVPTPPRRRCPCAPRSAMKASGSALPPSCACAGERSSVCRALPRGTRFSARGAPWCSRFRRRVSTVRRA
jgi:flagellar motor switch protein FliM